MPLAQYSHTASLDARGALAMALRRHIEGLTFAGSQAQQFAEVFEEWPSFNDAEVPPVACVLPGDWKYGDSHMTPRLLEDTWEPQGMPGWALYKTAELTCEFQLVIRTNLPAERPILIRAIEESFQHGTDQRYGILLDLPEYYQLKGTLALLGGSVIDNEDAAMREKRDAMFMISAPAPKVQVVPVWPMALSITKTFLDSRSLPTATETFTAP
jgi:hypothetical protein